MIFSMRFSKFPTKPRKNRAKVANTGVQLRELLENAEPGDLIQLEKGNFLGPFTIFTSNLYIEGRGVGKTFITLDPENENDELSMFPFKIEDDVSYTTISSLTIQGDDYDPDYDHEISLKLGSTSSNNTLKDLAFENCSLEVDGRFNRGESLSFTSTGEFLSTIHIRLTKDAAFNHFQDVSLSHSQIGVRINGKGNVFEKIRTENIFTGLFIKGDDNSVKGLVHNFQCDLREGPLPTEERGMKEAAVHIQGGSGNKVEDVECLNYHPLMTPKAYSLFFEKIPEGVDNTPEDERVPRNNVVVNCGPGRVFLDGLENDLLFVNGGAEFIMRGDGHSLESCSATLFSPAEDCVGVTVDQDCNFDL